jgi:hypothetical protein
MKNYSIFKISSIILKIIGIRERILATLLIDRIDELQGKKPGIAETK